LNLLNSKRGFVLAEVLVVAVIVAILAAVAIPTYTSYVRGQRQSVVKALAQTAAVSANVYLRRYGTAPPDSAALHLFLPDPDRFSVSIDSPYVRIQEGVSPDLIQDSARFN
jgi:prepilin-type N-terminal cleavage/methylation domain-containing protein